MLSLLGRAVAKIFEKPLAPRYFEPSEIVEVIRKAGGALDIDNFHGSELDLVYACVEESMLKLVSGSWAEPDRLMLPDYREPVTGSALPPRPVPD